MEPNKKLKYDGVAILFIFLGLLVFIGFSLFNSYTDGRLFADTLECPEGKYKVIADFTPTEKYWKIQPDGSYATCMSYEPGRDYIDLGSGWYVYFEDLTNNISNTINSNVSNNTTYKITFSINESEELPFNPDDWYCYDINGNEIPCSDPLSNDTAMIIV